MNELLNIFTGLPFTVQGIATYVNNQIVTTDSLGKYHGVEFRQPVACYLRAEPKDTPKDRGFIECGVRDYMIEVNLHLVVIDNASKFTIDSLMSKMSSLLNSTKDIVITKRNKDFTEIKTEENLTEINDGQMIKISFTYQYEFTNDCNELVCNC